MSMKHRLTMAILYILGFRAQVKYVYHKDGNAHWYPLKINDEDFEYQGIGIIAEKY